LLKTLIRGRQPVQLTSLELDVRMDEKGHLGRVDLLIRFLKSFHGLENLRLLIRGRPLPGQLWDAISHHESTLKQLVYHERPTVDRKESDIVNLPWNGSQSNGGLVRSKLEYVGLCCSAWQLVELLTPCERISANP
jgi:hypothetical protein